MTEFWLGVLAGAIGVWALGTITLIAIRGAEHSTPVAGGYWPDNEDELDLELQDLIDQDKR